MVLVAGSWQTAWACGNALIYSFLDEEQKKLELERFDRAYVDFERSLARQQPLMQNVIALMRAAVAP